MSYLNYFNIDKEYFSTVDNELIERKPDLWKKFYPHDTFKNLLNQLIDQQIGQEDKNKSIWVQGAYGTGKSHAVLTLKKILDSPNSDVDEYFNNFSDKLDGQLKGQISKVKERNILTVHKYGSSNVIDDITLTTMLQESIIKALKEKGATYLGETSVINFIKDYLKDSDNKAYFNDKIKKYMPLGGENADSIIEKFNSLKDKDLLAHVSKVIQFVTKELHLRLEISIDDLKKWIIDIKEKNGFDSIIFFWDETTDYFNPNMKLTGFQSLNDAGFVLKSQFYFVLVSHLTDQIFLNMDPNSKKIIDRFQKPVQISLPENMAFELLSNAVKKNPSKEIEWNSIFNGLKSKTQKALDYISNKAKVNKDILEKILPIHPYTGLILKNIATEFDANQRSMFSYINDKNQGGFKHYIEDVGDPKGALPLLTVDMLWEYFYENNMSKLNPDVKNILSRFTEKENKINAISDNKQRNDIKRILKSILLFQGMSLYHIDRVLYLIPTIDNIKCAFNGDPIYNKIDTYIEYLKNEHLINVIGDKLSVVSETGIIDYVRFAKCKKDAEAEFNTLNISENVDYIKYLQLSDAVKLRYNINLNTAKSINVKQNKAILDEEQYKNKLGLCVFVSVYSDKSNLLSKLETLPKENHILFLDCSNNEFSQNDYDGYINNMAWFKYYNNSSESNKYYGYAQDILIKWADSLSTCQFRLIYPDGREIKPMGVIDLNNELQNYTKLVYNNSLDNLDLASSLFLQGCTNSVVKVGVTETPTGSNNDANLKPNTNFPGVWKVANYWVSEPNALLSKIKVELDKNIEDKLNSNHEISIKDIYEFLKFGSYGFIPCNITAIVMGFLLKEYTNGNYRWRDNSTSDELTQDKLCSMVANFLKNELTPSITYRDEFITKLTEEENAFIDKSLLIFNLNKRHCYSAKSTISQLRDKMRDLGFPLWTCKELGWSSVENEFIDKYTDILNILNSSDDTNEQKIAFEIGKLFLNNSGIESKLKSKFTFDSCKEGMVTYINKNYHDLISLSNKIDGQNEYINIIKDKFSGSDNNWLWDIDTCKAQIEDVLLEYRIIDESNKINPNANSFDKMCEFWIETSKKIYLSNDCIIEEKPEFEDIVLNLVSLFDDRASLRRDKTQKNYFYKALVNSGSDFNDFLNNQIDTFKAVCSAELEGKTDEFIKIVFNELPNDHGYILGLGEYEYKNLVKTIITEKEPKKLETLQKFWLDTTGTTSPSDWAIKYKMSPSAMVSLDKMNEFKKYFNVLIYHPQYGDADFQEALDFFNANIIELNKFRDIKEIDKMFREKILCEYSKLFEDSEIDNIKAKLEALVLPFHWYGNAIVLKKVFELAEKKYKEVMKNKVMNILDAKNDQEIKELLYKLANDSVHVGLEIL